MLMLPAGLRVSIYREPVDMRKRPANRTFRRHLVGVRMRSQEVSRWRRRDGAVRGVGVVASGRS